MRLDQFLKWSRIVPRRTVAKATCDAGRVQVNDASARAGRQMAVGDVVAIELPHRRMTFRVAMLPERSPGKSDASGMVELISNERTDRSENSGA